MPLLNLDLDVRENGEIKPISIEMNKEELQNLINALEAANKVAFNDIIFPSLSSCALCFFFFKLELFLIYCWKAKVNNS